jgi:hypothetical protein
MPSYKMTLEVRIDCPEDKSNPENTITPKDILKSLSKDRGGSYAVCSRDSMNKLTASMHVLKAEFSGPPCAHCGQYMPKEE